MRSMAEVKTEVLERLKRLPVCMPDSAHVQWTVRCPYCGDSSDMSHGHFSIKIDIEDDSSPMLYRCFKCDASGVVGYDTLVDLGIDLDDDLTEALKKGNRRAAKKNRYTNDQVESYEVPVPVDNGLVKWKLAYINGRLGCNLGPNDCPAYKIIPDLDLFLIANKIDRDSVANPRILEMLQSNYVGFLSQSNNVITFRYLGTAKWMHRYYKLVLNKRNLNPASFYIIPGAVQVFSKDPMEVHIAEGIFDILGVRFLKEPNNSFRAIYGASCGFGPLAIMEYLVRNGLAQKATLHIYCDNDKTDEDELNLLRKRPEITCWFGDIVFHRNRFPNEKDYGVTQYHIVDGTRLVGRDGEPQ